MFKKNQRPNSEPTHIGIILKEFLQEQGAEEHLTLVELWKHWDIVMADFASFTTPLGYRGNILLIGVEDNLILQELSYQIPEIINLANAFLEKPFFTSVQFSQTNKTKQFKRYK